MNTPSKAVNATTKYRNYYNNVVRWTAGRLTRGRYVENIQVQSGETYNMTVNVLGCGPSENFAASNLHDMHKHDPLYQRDLIHGPTQSNVEVDRGRITGNIRNSSSVLVTIYHSGTSVKKAKILIDYSGSTVTNVLKQHAAKLSDVDAILATHNHDDASGGLQALLNHYGANPKGFVRTPGEQPKQRDVQYWMEKHVIGEQPPYLVRTKETPNSTNAGHPIHFIPSDGRGHPLPFEIKITKTDSVWVTPFKVWHAPPLTEQQKAQGRQRGHSLGFMIGGFLYCSDIVDEIPLESLQIIAKYKEGLKNKQFCVAMLDMLRVQSHSSHYGIGEFIHAAREIGAEYTLPTQTSGDGLSFRQWVEVWKAFRLQTFATVLPKLPKWETTNKQEFRYHFPTGEIGSTSTGLHRNASPNHPEISLTGENFKKAYDWSYIHKLYGIRDNDDAAVVQNTLNHINGFAQMHAEKLMKGRNIRGNQVQPALPGFRVVHSFDGQVIEIMRKPSRPRVAWKGLAT